MAPGDPSRSDADPIMQFLRVTVLLVDEEESLIRWIGVSRFDEMPRFPRYVYDNSNEVATG